MTRAERIRQMEEAVERVEESRDEVEGKVRRQIGPRPPHNDSDTEGDGTTGGTTGGTLRDERKKKRQYMTPGLRGEDRTWAERWVRGRD